jgi:hypothetical protein
MAVEEALRAVDVLGEDDPHERTSAWGRVSGESEQR